MFSTRTTLKKAVAVSLATVVSLGSFAATTLAQPSQVDYTSQANKAIQWIKTQQQPDGSFQGFGAGSTIDAALAIIAAGQSPDAFSNGGNTPITFLQSKATDLIKTPGSAGKALIVLGAVQTPTEPGSAYFVNAIANSYDANTGHYGKDVIGHAFAMLGMHAAGNKQTTGVVDFLRSTQTPEGGWAFSGDTTTGGADTNTTSVVVQALVATGFTNTEGPMIQKAVGYLESQQNPDGGFPYQKNDPQNNESDVNSTAYVSQAMYITGNYATADKANAFMASLQKPNGAFQWKKSEPDDNAGATYQAVPALLHATLAAPLVTQNTSESMPPTVNAPGMPTTGNAVDDLIASLAALAALLTGAGVVVQRKAVAR